MKTFYDPHPGFAGAAIKIPDVVRLVANAMNGKEMEVADAVRILQDAANTLVMVLLVTLLLKITAIISP